MGLLCVEPARMTSVRGGVAYRGSAHWIEVPREDEAFLAFLSQVLQRRRNHDTFKLVRVCAERHPELVDHFRVVELPAIFVVSGRRVQARVVAPKGRKELEEALAPWLN